MEVQSLSIVVPNKKCVNNCKFCVSQMHEDPYVNQIEKNKRFRDLYQDDYMARLQYARDNNCHTVIFTGNSEPLQNMNFLNNFSLWNKMLKSPFSRLELQSSGVLLTDETLRYLRNTVRVSTISISVSDIFDDVRNMDCIGTPPGVQFELDQLCSEIKRYDFNLRLSINLTSTYENHHVGEIFNRAKLLRADQITFRQLYSSNQNSEKDQWIAKNAASPETLTRIRDYISSRGKPLYYLPFGAMLYSIGDFGVVFDGDCMNTEVKNVMKYLILQPNCKLYSRWDDPASLVF